MKNCENVGKLNASFKSFKPTGKSWRSFDSSIQQMQVVISTTLVIHKDKKTWNSDIAAC